MNKKSIFSLFVFMLLFTSLGFAAHSTNVTLNENGNRIITSNTKTLTLTIKSNNTDPLNDPEIVNISINTSLSGFSILNSTDDDTELWDWDLTKDGNYYTLTNRTLIPGESVTFTLGVNITEVGTWKKTYITTQDELGEKFQKTLYHANIGNGSIGVDTRTYNNNPMSADNARLLLAGNDNNMNTSFLAFPDSFNSDDNLITTSSNNSDYGLFVFKKSDLTGYNLSDSEEIYLYVNVSETTSLANTKYRFPYSNNSFNQIRLHAAEIDTYNDNTRQNSAFSFSTNNSLSDKTTAYITVRSSAQPSSGNVYQTNNISNTKSYSNFVGGKYTYNASVNLTGINCIHDSNLRLQVKSNGFVSYKYLTVDIERPGNITSLDVAPLASQGAINISWSGTGSLVKPTYKIYKGTSNDSINKVIEIITYQNLTTNYIDYGLTNGTNYYYKVSILDLAGNENDSTIYKNATADEDETAPGSVTTVNAKAISQGRVNISWSAPEGEPVELYLINRSGDGIIHTTSGLSYIDTTATAGDPYNYTIITQDPSFNNNTAGVFSGIVVPDNQTPSSDAGDPVSVVLKTDKNSNGKVNIGDVIEINLTKAFDRNYPGQTSETEVANVTVDLSAFGGNNSVKLDNINSGPFGNYSTTFTVKSGTLDVDNKSVYVTIHDEVGNTKEETGFLTSPVNNYRTKINKLNIYENASATGNPIYGSLTTNRTYYAGVEFEDIKYRGDARIFVQVDGPTGVEYLGYSFQPSINLGERYAIGQGFKVTGTGDYTIRAFVYNSYWPASSNWVNLASSFQTTRTVG